MSAKGNGQATVVLHNIPMKNEKAREITIDNSVWNIGEKFKGFKKVPVGAHLIVFDCEVSKIGLYKVFKFFHVKDNEVLILEFDNSDLSFRKMEGSNPLHRIFNDCCDSLELDPYLGNYQVENYSIWRQSVSWVNSSSIDRVFPNSIKDHEQAKETTFAEELYAKKYNFIEIELNLKQRANRMGQVDTSELKELFRDRSKQLRHCLQFDYEYKGFESLMAEFQLSFALFMILEDIEGLEVWQQIVFLFCESEDFQYKEVDRTKDFLKTFFVMLKQMPSDFFYHDLTKNNFLIGCLQHLMSNLENQLVYQQFFEAFDGLLQEYFKFEWREVIINNREDDAHENNLLLNDEVPMIVESNQEYISF
jgi:hypothetical protein